MPEFLKWDDVFCRLSWQAQWLFFRLVLAVDDYRRCAVGPGPGQPVVLKSMCFPASAEVRITDVARWLQELQSAGAVAVRNSDRGWYVEVSERLWYRREDAAEGQPKYGPRHERTKPAVQGELPMGPVGVVQSGPGRTGLSASASECLPRNDVPTQRQTCTESKTKAKPNESAPAPSAEVRVQVPQARGGARSAEAPAVAGKAETEEAKRARGFYSRGAWSKPGDVVWVEFCEWMSGGDVSCKELWDNGAKWMGRLERNSRVMAEIVMQGRLMEKERPMVNRGAWAEDQWIRFGVLEPERGKAVVG
jgi:hypothetical protein